MTRTSILALGAFACLAAAPAPATYDVMLTMRDGDAPATHPRLLVRADEPATFMIGNESYQLRLTATPASADQVALAYQVAAWTPDGLRHHSDTIAARADGAPARIAFQRTDPVSGAVRRMEVDVSVRPAD